MPSPYIRYTKDGKVNYIGPFKNSFDALKEGYDRFESEYDANWIVATPTRERIVTLTENGSIEKPKMYLTK